MKTSDLPKHSWGVSGAPGKHDTLYECHRCGTYHTVSADARPESVNASLPEGPCVSNIARRKASYLEAVSTMEKLFTMKKWKGPDCYLLTKLLLLTERIEMLENTESKEAPKQPTITTFEGVSVAFPYQKLRTMCDEYLIKETLDSDNPVIRELARRLDAAYTSKLREEAQIDDLTAKNEDLKEKLARILLIIDYEE